jgi:hypothetical protein
MPTIEHSPMQKLVVLPLIMVANQANVDRDKKHENKGLNQTD